MQKTLTAAAALAAVFVAAPAFAQMPSTAPSNYIQGNVGLGFAGRATVTAIDGATSARDHEDLNDGLFVSALVGHGFGNGLAVEAEGIYSHNRVDDSDLTAAVGNVGTHTWGALGNLKYEVPTQWHGVSPYVAGGAGYGDIHVHVQDQGGDNHGGFMWQAKAGLAYKMNDKMTWDLGYRYLDQPDFKDSANDGAGGVETLKIKSHENVVSLGARLTF